MDVQSTAGAGTVLEEAGSRYFAQELEVTQEPPLIHSSHLRSWRLGVRPDSIKHKHEFDTTLESLPCNILQYFLFGSTKGAGNWFSPGPISCNFNDQERTSRRCTNYPTKEQQLLYIDVILGLRGLRPRITQVPETC